MANTVVRIGSQCVGDGHPPFLIAEIGINHNGDLSVAKKLIDGAFATNWHCVKFQKRTPALCVPERQKAELRDTPWGRITYLEYRHKVEFGSKEYDYIDHYCGEKPILWSASAWDIPSVDFLLSYNVPFIKLPSAKLTDTKLVKYAAGTGRPVILSTGMSTIAEIDEAVECLEAHTTGDYILMHTNSTYPTPPQEINIRMLHTLKQRYRCVVGYSGHEYGLEPSVVAVILGACVLERHITLSHEMWGSDHFASLEVHAMDLLQKRIRSVTVILGDGEKRLTENELQVRKRLRG